MKNRFASRGFTLIELLVVIAIIGILSSVVLASLSTARAKSRDARRIADLDQLRTALEMYFDANSTYPTTTAATAAQTWNNAGTFSGTSATLGINIIATTSAGTIAKIPTPPSAGYNYYYCAANASSWSGLASCNSTSANTATTYLLGADLERSDNAALKTDADISLTTATNFSGTDNSNCVNGATGSCFDLTN